MKTKIILITLTSFLALTIFVLQSCDKDDKTNQSPTCTITSPTNGQEIVKGETVTISVDASDSDGSITRVSFSVDGIEEGSTESYPYSFNWVTSIYSVGSHTLKASSIDNNGDSNSDEISVVIDDTPNAAYYANPTSGFAPLSVNFTDQSTNSPTNYQWNFGDGSSSTEQNPLHIYNDNGTYTVALTVNNSYGSNTEAKANLIIVSSEGTSTFTDPRDGRTYNTVEIGNQTWFAENLNYETTNSWWYDNSITNGNIYGRLYTWVVALTACPSGWSLPSDDEWKQMEMALGMSQSEADDTSWRGTDEGKKMKSTSGWHMNGNGTNSSGFNALPGGYRGSSGSFSSLDGGGLWWSSTEYEGTNGWERGLFYDNDQVARSNYGKTYGLSVRCLKN